MIYKFECNTCGKKYKLEWGSLMGIPISMSCNKPDCYGTAELVYDKSSNEKILKPGKLSDAVISGEWEIVNNPVLGNFLVNKKEYESLL